MVLQGHTTFFCFAIFLSLKKNYWSIVDVQCVNFCCTAKWFSCTYIYILFHILFHDGLSQDIEYSSLCSTVVPCCLSILCRIVLSCNISNDWNTEFGHWLQRKQALIIVHIQRVWEPASWINSCVLCAGLSSPAGSRYWLKVFTATEPEAASSIEPAVQPVARGLGGTGL